MQQLPLAVADGQHRAAMEGVAGDAEPPFPEDRLGPRSGLAAQDVADVLAVGGAGRPDGAHAGEGAERGQQIDRRQHRLGLRPARPECVPGQRTRKRHAHAALVQAALAAAERARRSRRRCGWRCVMWMSSGPLSLEKSTSVSFVEAQLVEPSPAAGRSACRGR